MVQEVKAIGFVNLMTGSQVPQTNGTIAVQVESTHGLTRALAFHGTGTNPSTSPGSVSGTSSPYTVTFSNVTTGAACLYAMNSNFDCASVKVTIT